MPGRAGQVQDGDVTWGCGTKARDRDIPAAAHQLELGGLEGITSPPCLAEGRAALSARKGNTTDN